MSVCWNHLASIERGNLSNSCVLGTLSSSEDVPAEQSMSGGGGPAIGIDLGTTYSCALHPSHLPFTALLALAHVGTQLAPSNGPSYRAHKPPRMQVEQTSDRAAAARAIFVSSRNFR